MSRDPESEAAIQAFLARGGEVTRAATGEGLHLSRRQWRELGSALMDEKAKILSRHKPFDYLVIQTTWGILVGRDPRRGRHRFKKIAPTDERARRLYDEGAAQRVVQAMGREHGCRTAVILRVAGGEVQA